MSSQHMKRRLLGALLAVAIALTGCGGGDRASGPSCERPGASFEKPATRLTFRAPDADTAQVDQARRILCARLAGLRVEHRVQRAAGNALAVDVPRASGLADPKADQPSIFGEGRLAIYDWEANVIGPDGKPSPGDPDVTGGPAAGQGSPLSLYDAVLRAAKRPVGTVIDGSRAGSLFYAVDPGAEKVFALSGSAEPGAPTRSAALAAVPPSARDRARVYEVRQGTVMVRAEGAQSRSGSWVVLRDDVALRGAHVVDPRQEFAEGPGATGQPIVTFEFTAEGAPIWRKFTRELAERGSRSAAARSGAVANQHFAVVVDDAIVTTPFIDFRVNPRGIDGPGSVIEGGFTIASARRLAALLASDPLPAALERVGSSAAP